MRSSKRILAAVALLQFGAGSYRLDACSCGPTPPPCEAYWQSPLVFLGTVVEKEPSHRGHFGNATTTARMRIDHAYKGITESFITLVDDGMCDGPNLQVGEQYLMYTYRIEKDRIAARGCTRSRDVRLAQEDLQYLDGLDRAAPTAAVFGRVVSRPDGPGFEFAQPNATVHLRGTRDTSTSVADSEGRYAFTGLEPGKYTVTANQPGYHMPGHDDGSYPVTVQSRGCAEIAVTLLRDRPGIVAGRVYRSNGAPAGAGIDVQLLRWKNEEYSVDGDFALTDDQGTFAFRDLDPGKYKLVLHGCCFPTPQVPYPAIYWPSAASEKEGSEILVSGASDPPRYDFRLPPEANRKTISGRVLLPDGQPAAESFLWLLKTGDSQHERCDVAEELRTDADGRFSVTILQGIHYALALRFDGRPNPDMLPVSFDAVPDPIVLRKVPGKDEN